MKQQLDCWISIKSVYVSMCRWQERKTRNRNNNHEEDVIGLYWIKAETREFIVDFLVNCGLHQNPCGFLQFF